jgi:anti-sigma factor RsiW
MNGTHCTEDELHSLIDGGLSPAAEEETAAHLRSCPACRNRHGFLLRFDAAVKGIPLSAAGPGFTGAVMSRLDLSLPSPRAFRFFTWVAYQLGFLVVAAVMSGVFLVTGTIQPGQVEAGKSAGTDALGSLHSLVAAVTGAVDGWLRTLIPPPTAGSLEIVSLTALVVLTLLLVDRSFLKKALNRTR